MNARTKEIASDIMAQIGAMTFRFLGTKPGEIGAGSDQGAPYLSFKIRGSKKVNYVKVIYMEGMDLYKMQFIKSTPKSFAVVAEHCDVYSDMMHQLIEKETGLYTHF